MATEVSALDRRPCSSLGFKRRLRCSWSPMFSGLNNSKAAELLGLSYSTYDRAHTVYACVDRITSRARRCPWVVQQHGSRRQTRDPPPFRSHRLRP